MTKWIPDRKVWAGGLAAVLAWLLAQALQQLAGVTLAPDTAAAIVAGAGGLVAYWVPPSLADLARRADDTLRRLGPL